MSPDQVDVDGAQAPVRRAAQYVRMSTEHQQFSTANQIDTIGAYARKRGIEIVATYADEGKSGLSLGGRPELQRLLHDVSSGTVPFRIILVYDVSRWGRFQDADESAYYEYHCRCAGFQVAYCAEQFENDGSPLSTILKGLKRAMAAEYSRELSVKVFAGQCKLIERGFRQGGRAGYGLRRALVDSSGAFKQELAPGDRKSIQTDRVVLVLGPAKEVATVNMIFDWYVDDKLCFAAIARRLRKLKSRTDLGREWTESAVHLILKNERYLGHNVYNRQSMKLGNKGVRNPPESWVRKDHAFPGIVSVRKFEAAQAIMRERQRRPSDEELLGLLRRIHQERGSLSIGILDESRATSGGYRVFSRRFGGLVRAYELIGYEPSRNLRFAENLRAQVPLRREIMRSIESQMTASGSTAERVRRTTRLLVNGEFSLAIQMTQAHAVVPLGPLRWRILSRHSSDIMVVVRLDPSAQVVDYLILPMFNVESVLFSPRNEAAFNRFRFDSLHSLFELTQRTELPHEQEDGLFADARLVSLLRSEGMTTYPSCLSRIVWPTGARGTAGGRAVLNLVVLRSYLARLLANRRIALFLRKIRPDVGDRTVALARGLDAELGLATPWHRHDQSEMRPRSQRARRSVPAYPDGDRPRRAGV
jgi:DNA invertase Pin-like site-specific DNA recombinase